MTPGEIDRNAPVVVKLERTIAAPPERLWALHTDVPRWTEWQRDITSAGLDGEFAVGTSFTWMTNGLDQPVTSTLYAVQPGCSTLWGGPAAGIIGIHHWMFTPVDGGTTVMTEESWSGDPVAADPHRSRDLLEASLRRWLDFLEGAATATKSDAGAAA